MAVREENVARRWMSVKGYATDCGDIFTATRERLRRRFPGGQTEPAVIQFPMTGLPESRAGDFLYDAKVVAAFGFRNAREKGFAEHVDPGGEAAFAVFELGGPIEEKSLPDFEAMLFEERGIFRDARVIPGVNAVGRSANFR